VLNGNHINRATNFGRESPHCGAVGLNTPHCGAVRQKEKTGTRKPTAEQWASPYTTAAQWT